MRKKLTLFLFCVVSFAFAQMRLEIQLSPSPCGDENAEIAISVTGGTAPFSYKLINPYSFETVKNFETENRSVVFSGLMSGYYFINVIDGSEEFQEESITIEDTSLSADVELTNDDEITVTAHNGSLAYTYRIAKEDGSFPNGDVFVSSNVFSNLEFGKYKITVKDSNGCTYETEVLEVVEALKLTLEEKKDINCGRSCDGIITVKATGGVKIVERGFEGYSFELLVDGRPLYENFQNSFSDLCSGIYTVKVTDFRGLTKELVVTLTGSDPILSNINVTDVDGSALGEIEFKNVTGGVPPYQYSIDQGRTYQDTPLFKDLEEGTYSLIIKDSKGCAFEDRVDVGAKLPMEFTVDITNPSCLNKCNASITANARGGSGKFSYELIRDDELVLFSGEEYSRISNLCSGSYTLKVKDVVDQTELSRDFIIVDPKPINANIIVVQSDLQEGQSVEVTDVSGGQPPYEYSIDGGRSYQFEATFLNLSSGQYQVIVKDSKGCSFTTQYVNVKEPLNAVVRVTNIACFEDNDNGKVEINSTGGSGSYSYELYIDSIREPIATSKQPYFYGLVPGNYSVVVKDGTLQITQYFRITKPSEQLSLTLTTQDVLCKDSSDGSISFSTKGGWGNYVYQVEKVSDASGAIVEKVLQDFRTYPNQSVLSGLSSGFYKVTVKDLEGCTVFQIVEIRNKTAITAEVVVNNEMCSSSDQATITVLNVLGGTGSGYLYTLYDGSGSKIGDSQSDNVFKVEAPGEYQVVTEDSNGCTGSNSVTLLPVSLDKLEIEVVSPQDCNGKEKIKVVYSPTTDVTLMVLDGSNTSVSPITAGGDEFILDSSKGSHTVKLVNNSGCELSKVHVFTPKPTFELDVVTQSVLCFGDSNGRAVFSFDSSTPYTGNYAYEVYVLGNPLAVVGTKGSSSFDVSDLPSGSYTVSVVLKDYPFCTIEKNFSISEPLLIEADYSTDTPETIEIKNVRGGVPPYIYSLVGIDRPESSNPIFTNLSKGVYKVLITDANGCMREQQVEIITLGKEKYDLTTFKLYPNPTKDILNIPSYLVGKEYQIYSLLGNSVVKTKLIGNTINVENLANGCYFLRFKDYKPLKFIKQ